LKPLVVARRGDAESIPESTLPAFESAIAKGADCVEFDVHLTRDGELVVHHDYYLGRTCEGSGFIGDFSFDELRRFDVGGWFGEEFAGERMPTLAEVLELGRGRTRFEIDMRSPTLRFLEQVLEFIDRFGVEDDVELTSSHVPLLFAAKAMRPRLRVGVFFRPLPEWMRRELGEAHVLGWMRLMDAVVAHLPSALIRCEFVGRLQAEGYLVHASNLNREDGLRHSVLAGVDQFSTDRLGMALAVRDDHAAGSGAG